MNKNTKSKDNQPDVMHLIQREAEDLYNELERMLTKGEPRSPISQRLLNILKLRAFDTYIDETRYFLMTDNGHDYASNLTQLKDIFNIKL